MSRSIRGGGIWSHVFPPPNAGIQKRGPPPCARLNAMPQRNTRPVALAIFLPHHRAFSSPANHKRPPPPNSSSTALLLSFIPLLLPKKSTMVKKMRSRSTTAVAIVLLCSTLRLAAAISDGEPYIYPPPCSFICFS